MQPRYYEAVWEATACPVCKTDLGYRDKNTLYKAHCDDCKATYWWYPKKDKPSATLDSESRKRHCGCGCGR